MSPIQGWLHALSIPCPSCGAPAFMKCQAVYAGPPMVMLMPIDRPHVSRIQHSQPPQKSEGKA